MEECKALLSGWTPTSWRDKEALQQPNYDDQEVGPPRPGALPSAATRVRHQGLHLRESSIPD